MRRTQRAGAGFSMVEVLIVIAIILIVSVVAVVQIGPVARNARVDTAASYVLNEMRHTRERAIDERRKYQITFATSLVTPFATMNVFQGNTNTAVVTPVLVFTADSSISLPFDLHFQAPNPKPATAPDGLCSQSNAIDFTVTGAPGCGTDTTLTFNPDGSITDAVGGLSSGVIYMGRPNDPLATRAVSFFGATGRTKGWRMVTSGATWIWSIQ
jgi:prepilin-type N-terminal cleavage/methylation domain-containing protein